MNVVLFLVIHCVCSCSIVSVSVCVFVCPIVSVCIQKAVGGAFDLQVLHRCYLINSCCYWLSCFLFFRGLSPQRNGPGRGGEGGGAEPPPPWPK